jgi:hypothetical protein
MGLALFKGFGNAPGFTAHNAFDFHVSGFTRRA